MSSAQTMKIYSIISRIEEELEESPRTKFAGAANKRIVEIERLFDLISDLKVTIPEDIRRATGILAEAQNTVQDAKENAEEIMENAKKEADQILQNAQTSAENIYRNAQIEYENRVSDSAVYQEALKRANEISEEAEKNANAIYNGARKYADEILSDLQSYISDYHKMIDANREELNVTPVAKRQPAPQTQPAKEFNDKIVSKQPVKLPENPPVNNAYMSQPETKFDREPLPAGDEGFFNDSFEDEPVKPIKAKKKALKQKEPVFEDEYEDFEEEEDVKPKKKKGLFSRMFEVEDDDEDYDDDFDDDFDDEPVKPKKKSKR